MKIVHARKPLPADYPSWRQVRLVAGLPRDPAVTPHLSLMVVTHRLRVPNVDWVETWEPEAPLSDPQSVERVYEWLLGSLWDRLDM